MKIGVLGAGEHARSHCAALRMVCDEHPGRCELQAICDLIEEKARSFRNTYGFLHHYVDVEEMIAHESLDGLVVVSPVESTVPLAIELLRHRIPLVIEKPAGTDSREAARLEAALAETGVAHMISYNRRFSPALREIRGWVARDPVGRRPGYVLARMLRHGRLEDAFVRGTGVHLLDVVLSLLGPALSVTTTVARAPTGRCLHYYSTIAFPEGGHAQTVIAPDAGSVEETYEIHGAGYRAKLDFGACRANVVQGETTVIDWRAPSDAPPELLDGSVDEMRGFLSLLEGRRPGVATVTDAVAGLKLAEAVERGGTVAFTSNEPGGTVELAESGPAGPAERGGAGTDRPGGSRVPGENQ